MQSLQRSIDKLTQVIDGGKLPVKPGAPVSTTPTAKPGSGEAMEQLAGAVANLVTQMREEQKMVRQWAQSQQTQTNEIQRMLARTPASRGSRARVDEE